MRTHTAVAAILLFGVPVGAQEAREEDRPRLTVGVSALHQLTVIGGYESNRVPFGLHVGWRMSDRIGVQADIVQYRESLGVFDLGEEIRTLRWWTGGAVFYFNDTGRIRPHAHAGVELLSTRTTTAP